MITGKRKPSLLGVVLMILEDGCPPEAGAQLCGLADVDDGETCKRCWRRYAFYVANGRKTGAKRRNHRNHRNQRTQ